MTDTPKHIHTKEEGLEMQLKWYLASIHEALGVIPNTT